MKQDYEVPNPYDNVIPQSVADKLLSRILRSKHSKKRATGLTQAELDEARRKKRLRSKRVKQKRKHLQKIQKLSRKANR